MANEKHRKFSRKLRSLFTTKGPDSDTALAVLNSGISLNGQTITQLNDESLCASEHQSPQADATPDLRGQVLAPTSPILQSPMSPITPYVFDNPDDDMLAQDRERTHMRYQAAVATLKEALELRSTVWSDQDPLEFADLLEKDDASELSTIIENRLNHVSNASPISKKARKLFQQIFVVFFPLTRNLLLVAKEAQAVGSLFLPLRWCLPFVADSLIKSMWAYMWWSPSPSYGILLSISAYGIDCQSRTHTFGRNRNDH
jgi:hypothetical protein